MLYANPNPLRQALAAVKISTLQDLWFLHSCSSLMWADSDKAYVVFAKAWACSFEEALRQQGWVDLLESGTPEAWCTETRVQ